MKRRLAERGSLKREELSKDMDDFIAQCVDEFLKKHRSPIIENIEKNSKFNVGQVMDRLASRHSKLITMVL